MDTLKEMRGALGRVHEFLIALEKAGFTEETIVEIINSKGNQLAGEMFNSLPEVLRSPVSTKDVKFSFKVDKETILKAFKKSISNNYDGEIMENRKSLYDETNPEEIEGKIFHFNYFIDEREILQKMKKCGCRPATDYEALTFCELNKPWAKQYNVSALGAKYKTTVTGEEYFPMIYCYENRLITKTYCCDNNYPPAARFLGIKIK